MVRSIFTSINTVHDHRLFPQDSDDITFGLECEPHKKSELGIKTCSVNVALETFRSLQGWTSCREDIMTSINVFFCTCFA